MKQYLRIHFIINVVKVILERQTISKEEVETLAYFALTKHDLASAFKGVGGFPSIICVCVNDEIIHGVPKSGQKIVKGDLVSLDFGVKLMGIVQMQLSVLSMIVKYPIP